MPAPGAIRPTIRPVRVAIGPESARSASAWAARSVRFALRVSERSTRPAVVYSAPKAQPMSRA